MKILQGLCAFLVAGAAVAQVKPLKMDILSDNANHWYHLKDKHNIIDPLPDQPRYAADNYTGIGDNILLFQRSNGGWPKNYDVQAMLTPEQANAVRVTKDLLNTTFDNRSTYTHIALLAQIYQATQQEKYKTGALQGFDFILSAQYANGGWPQYYPLEKNNYSTHITLNDDAMAGILFLLKDVKEGDARYAFLDEPRRIQLVQAFDKGIDCLLKMQINDAGKPTAWCQQHDEFTLQPAWARKFELPCICNGESVKVVQLLMSIRQPSPAVIAAVENAVEWFKTSKIEGIRVDKVAAPPLETGLRTSTSDRVVVNDPAAKPIWTRFYELKTHRPMFCNRDSRVVYSLAEVDRERRDGYSWYTYEPQKVLDAYPAWKAALRS
jgi:PelA/Pel-15E family pectate lyase